MAGKPANPTDEERPSKDVRDYYSPDKDQPFLPEDGIRLVPTIRGAHGYRDVVHIAPGFDMVVGDVRHEQSASITVAENAVMKLHYRLSGSGRASLDGDKELDIPERSSSLLLHPDGIRKKEWFFAGQHEQSVTLLCTPEFLASQLPDIISRLPHPISAYLKGEAVEVHQRILPLRADMAQAAGALLACELSGSVRRLYAEAKAFELLTLTIQALIEGEQGLDRYDSGLTPTDIEHLHAARAYLEKNFLETITIANLAAEVDMNPAKLMRSFKLVFGSTIFGFAQQLRMERAKKLLETTPLSVTQIALEVGYEYASNFTTAFRRHFGITPKSARDAAR